MGWVEDALAREKGRREAAQAASMSDAGYIGGFLSSTISGVGEMFGMDAFPTAERFRQDYPISGLVSELGSAVIPYAGWEGVIARSPRIATALGGAAGRLGLSATTSPIAHSAASMAIRYAPVELSRLGIGLFTTDDWNKYSGLMADVGLSTMLAGGIGSLGGFLRTAGKSNKVLFGKVAEAPTGLAAPFELRMLKSPNTTIVGNIPREMVRQRLISESLTERPVAQKAVHALADNAEPRAVTGLNILFKESKGNKAGIVRQKLMSDNGTWNLGEDGNSQLLGALGKGFKSMDDVAEAGRFSTHIGVGSDRAAGTMRKALDGLSPVGDGAFLAQEPNGLFVVVKRIKIGEQATKAAKARAELERQITELDSMISSPLAKGKLTSLKAAQRKLYGQLKKSGPPNPVGEGDEFFAIMTDQPDRFISGVSKTARKTVDEFAKYRAAYRPEVNQGTIFNEAQNRIIGTFTPQNLMDIKAGKTEKAYSDWIKRMTSKSGDVPLGGGMALKDSEVLRKFWDAAYHSIAPSMAKGLRNSFYDRLFMMLGINKTTAESSVNKMIGGAVQATRRKSFGMLGPRLEHASEVAPGIRTVNKLFSDNAKLLTPDDYRLFQSVSESQAPKELIAELTANGQVSPAAQNVLDGLQAIDKWFWSQFMPVAKSLGLDAKFSLLEGAYIPKILKGDNYVAVVEEGTKKVKFYASGTRLQAQQMADAFVDAGKAAGKNYKAEAPRTWYFEGDELLAIHKQMNDAVLSDPQIKEIARTAMRNLAINQAGMRTGVLKAQMPKSLTTERAGVASSSGEYGIKEIISDLQQHYGQIAKYLGYESWKQRWAFDYTRLGGRSELSRLKDIDRAMYDDINRRAAQMMGYASPQAKYLDSTLNKVFGGAIGGKAASKIAQTANQLMYHWNIGLFNPTFSLVNLLTPLQTTMPWIALMQSAPQAADDLMHTTFRFNAAGKPTGIMNFLEPAKVMGKALRTMGNPSDELLEFWGRAKTDGGLSPQMFENFGGHGSAASVGIREAFNRAGGGVEGFIEGLKKTATWTSTHSEEWSREFSFTAAYVLGRDLKGLKGEALYQFARRATHVTMYGYHAMDRSMMFTGPVGSMFGLFKNWQMHFISSMMQYAGLGWREGNWAPLMWQFAGSLAVGGIGATPLVLAADQITDWMDDQPNSYLWMKENWHDAPDEIYYGLPAMFGVSLQASSALPGTDVRNDLTMLSNFVFFERAQAAFKATKGAWDYAEQTGQNPLRNPNVADALLQGFAPRALFRLFSTTEGDAIKSMSSGYPQIRDVNPLGAMAYRLGFNPVEIEKQQDAARYLWREQTAQRDAIAGHGARLANAELNGDVDEISATINSAIALGLPMSSVAKSAQTRLRREQQQDLLTKYGGEGDWTRMILNEGE